MLWVQVLCIAAPSSNETSEMWIRALCGAHTAQSVWCILVSVTKVKQELCSSISYSSHRLKFVRKISSSFVEHRQDFIIEVYLTFVSLLVILTLMRTRASKGN